MQSNPPSLEIKKHILLALNEPLETFPIAPPFKNEEYLKNQELLTLVNKYSHLLSPMHKKILSHQKALHAGVPITTPKPILNNIKKPPQPMIIPSKIGPTQFPFQNTPFMPMSNNHIPPKFPIKPPLIAAPILNPNMFQGSITSLASLPEEHTHTHSMNNYMNTTDMNHQNGSHSRQLSEGYHVTFDGSEFDGPELMPESKKMGTKLNGYKEEDDIFL